MIVSNVCLFGQATNDPREDFLYGEFYIEQSKFSEALPFYLSSLKHNPENCNINYRVGQCYLNILGKQQKSLPYLEKSVKEIDPHYVAGKYKKNEAPPEAWLLLGDIYHRENMLLKASYAYNKYREFMDESDIEKVRELNERIVALGISLENQRKEKEISLINLGPTINSRFSDYNPVFNGNREVMIYTQYWESVDRIMMTKYTPDGWTEPVELNEQLRSSGNCFTSSLSYDGSTLYLVKLLDDNYDLYVSEMKDSAWGEMKSLNAINTRHHESSACISSDGYYLYFASDRPGGKG
ncbi:MAG: hypothetical protein PVF73_09355, partial [Bacteroidales bacterium]